MALYECAFCAKGLKPDRPRWYQYPLLVVLVRPYYCPHCGDRALRPITSLKNLFSDPARNHGGGSSSRGRDWSGDSTASAGKASRRGHRTPTAQENSDSHSHSPEPETAQEASPSRGTRGDQDQPTTASSKKKRSGQDRSRRSSRDPSRSAKQRSRTLAGLTGDEAPHSYGRPNIVFRLIRRVWRRARRMFGKSTSSSSRRSHRSKSRNSRRS